jgi:hypothetical protein
MANIGIRSPYFIYKTEASALSCKIEVSINSVLRYTIIKNTGASARIDVSELVRDYIEPEYDGTLDLGLVKTASISVDFKFYPEADAGGTQLGTTQNETHTAYDGYGYFYEEHNFDFNDQVLLSGNTLWLPQGEATTFYKITSDSVSVVPVASDVSDGASVEGITIRRQLCSKYDFVKVVFINKFGIPQETFFFAKRVEAINSMGDSYKSSNINMDGSYNSYSHQVVDFHKNAIKAYTLNTGYIDEEFNNYMQEIMLSEQIWLNIPGNTPQIIPVRLRSSSVSYKTSLNDKLVDYTVEFEESNDLINSIR